VATPAFRYMGGKARLRNWLIQHFPPSGNIYLEPFAGLGNVFFAAKNSLDFKKWWLNDTNPFLRSLLKVDLESLPPQVSKDDFDSWKSKNDDVARVIEPRITFGGKGYKYGYSGSSGTHKGYNGKLYRGVCNSAKELLAGVSITNLSWEKLNIPKLSSDDFVYCDPPYFGTSASYSNIKHEDLVRVLNASRCRWAISGYSNNLYDTHLNYKNCYVSKRNSEIKGSNARKKKPVVELLWTNF